MTIETSGFAIHDAVQLADLWKRAYNETGRPDWSHLLPYYAKDVHFSESVQRIDGIKPFNEMFVVLLLKGG